MVSCHHNEALNYKFKHKRANKSLKDVDLVAQWLKQKWLNLSTIAIKSGLWGRNPQKVPMFPRTIEVDIELTNKADKASILLFSTIFFLNFSVFEILSFRNVNFCSRVHLIKITVAFCVWSIINRLNDSLTVLIQ